MSYTFGEADARLFYHGVLRPGPGEWVEVRAIQWVKLPKRGDCLPTGVNSEDDFIKICAYWNGQRHVYAGVNPRKTRRGSKTGDVARIKVIPFDVDAPHPKETAANDAELEQARALKDRLVTWMGGRGFSMPYIDFSGNGYRVAILVDLPATQANFDKVNQFYEEANLAMGGVLDNISDPPRIIKVPGTWAIKGPNDPERPHRLSHIIQMGELAVNFRDTPPLPSLQPVDVASVAKIAPVSTPSNVPTLVNRMKPCFRRFIENGTRMSSIAKYEHETALRLALVDEAYSVGITNREDIIGLFGKAENFNEKKTGYEIDRKLKKIKSDGPHPYHCSAIMNHGGCLGVECQLHSAAIQRDIQHTGVDQFVKSIDLSSERKEVPPTLRVMGNNQLTNTPTPACYISRKYPSWSEALDVMGLTVASDLQPKEILFANLLLNETDNDQQNLGFSGPSSSGKTHIALNVVDLFPKEDIIKIDYVTPKAFFHKFGDLVASEDYGTFHKFDKIPTFLEVKRAAKAEYEKSNPRPIGKAGAKRKDDDNPTIGDWKDGLKDKIEGLSIEWAKIPKVRLVNFEKKIVVLKDMPVDDLLKHIRSLMSHDEKIYIAEITDSKSGGGNLTKTVWLLGYGTFVFLSARFNQDEQEQTRLWLLSPEITQNKLESSIKMTGLKLANRNAFNSKVEANEARQALKTHLRAIKELGIREIIVNEDQMNATIDEFLAAHKDQLSPRHQRDFPRLIALAKAHALYYYTERDITPDNDLTVKLEDLEYAKSTYATIAGSNELGIPPQIYELWIDKLKPILESGWRVTRREVAKFYYEMFKTNIGDRALKGVINLLNNTGIVAEDMDPDDSRRKVLISPMKFNPKLHECYECGSRFEEPNGVRDKRGWICNRCQGQLDAIEDRRQERLN
jgi:hypothetical protein